jgi:hypothetical protein
MKRDLVREDIERARLEIERDLAREDAEGVRVANRSSRISFFLAVFLILLMLSFLYLSYPVYSYVLGLAGSSKLSGNDVLFRNSVLVSFDDDTLSFLQDLYDPFGDERAVCLTGSISGNNYVVSNFYEPVVFDSSWNFVSHSPCLDDTIIMLHTHPFSRCEPSRTDRVTLARSKINNPGVIMLVMCGSERFSAVI